MNVNGLVDKRSYLNIFGCLLQDPSLLDDLDRPLSREDFNTEKFYELLFVAIYNLHAQGCEKIDEFSVDSYLSNYKDQYGIFQTNNGLEYLVNAEEIASLDNYDYFYHRCRKFSLLRYYEEKGLDTRPIYDTTIADVTQIEQEQLKFDLYTEQDIVELVEATFVIKPTMKFCTNNLTAEIQAGSSGLELIQQFMEIPDIGLPLSNEGLNTVSRGARRGCLFMRSAPSGGGKSRMLASDVCKFAVPYYWDGEKWQYTGISEPTLYITTEMEYTEIQTLLFACISKVDEEHILYGNYEPGEFERVEQAIHYIESAPLYIVHIPDFSIEDIKNIIKKYRREFGVDYFAFDYIHTSLRLMAEVNGKSGMGLKEHQLLLVFATELKALAQQLDVFIFTASQLTRDAVDARYKDQALLAGAVALCNKLDAGIISIRPNKSEQKKLQAIIQNKVGLPGLDCGMYMGHWIYKVRRGKLTKIIVWSLSNFATMTETALFVTDFDFNLIDIDFTEIEAVEKEVQQNSVLISSVKHDEEIPPFDPETGEIFEEKEAQIKPSFNW